MCFAAAIPLASLAISAASSMVGFAGQQATANAQARAWEANQVRALAADRDTQNSLTIRQMQEQDAYTQKLNIVNLDEARRQAEAEVTGEKMGMGGGVNIQNLVADIGRRTDANRVTLMSNWNDRVTQLQDEKVAANDLEESRVNSVSAGTQPSILDPLAKTAGAGFRFFGDLEKQKRPLGETV